MKLLREYLLTLLALVVLAIIYTVNRGTAVESVTISLSGVWMMFQILPPILIIMNLLDALVPKELVMKHMGREAGFRAYFWAFVLGTFAAGPLYAAFPIAALLAKKNARLSSLVFFLGMWTVTKLPVFTYELNYFGLPFTGLHILTGIVFYFLLSILLEKLFLKNDQEQIYATLSKM